MTCQRTRCRQRRVWEEEASQEASSLAADAASSWQRLGLWGGPRSDTWPVPACLKGQGPLGKGGHGAMGDKRVWGAA
eukprot:807571-Rhodomonas_salina.1